jgi:hypothetical protein
MYFVKAWSVADYAEDPALEEAKRKESEST